MPITTARNDLVSAIQFSLHSYWKIRAANALTIRFAQGAWLAIELHFDNIPASAYLQAPPKVPANLVLGEIDSYITGGRAARDYFFAVIAHFELFLSKAIVLRGGSADGTLGQLMNKAQQLYGFAVSSTTELADEIRERRNVLIHHGGVANQRYLNSASSAALPANIRLTVMGQILLIDDNYLAWVCDSLISYSLLF
jgi:hypothetical protein